MRSLLIDTNAYVSFMRGEPTIVEALTHAEFLSLNVTILGELLAGFAAGNREAKNRAQLAQFLDSPRVRLTPLTTDTAD